MSASPQPRMTPEEYLEFERASEFRHEYYDGVVYAMSGASWPHVLITGNIARALGNQLENKPCYVSTTDLKVRISPQGFYAYPDVVVICGEPKLADARRDVLLNPTLLLEVLSPSTEAYDRGFKFNQYQSIDSLQEYALVSQSESRVEVFRRHTDGNWLFTKFQGSDRACYFQSIDCELALPAIYSKIDFNQAKSALIPPDPNLPR
jgi:Uma2 family endonuclease